jgi:hypothetical protein
MREASSNTKQIQAGFLLTWSSGKGVPGMGASSCFRSDSKAQSNYGHGNTKYCMLEQIAQILNLQK